VAVSLSHLGEDLIARMANQMRLGFLDVCNLAQACDRDFVLSTGRPIAYTEAKLLPYGGKSFDGASRVDVVVLLTPTLGVPFEVKLGTARLSKSRIDEEWLSGCGVSHNGRRHTGNMMSILEHRFQDHVGDGPLRAQVRGHFVDLTDEWFIIAHESVLETWEGERRPAFSSNVYTCSLKKIVEKLGGREPFNQIVKGMLDFDYYSEWALDDDDEESENQ